MSETPPPTDHVLHLTSGAASAHDLEASGAAVGADVVGFDEAYIDGPRPEGGAAGKWQWRRSRHVHTVYAVSLDQAIARQQAISALVAEIVAGRRTVLWFERDLFCQANLAGLLYRCTATGASFDAPIELVLVDDGAFGAGDTAWNVLLDKRTPVTPQMVADACTFWEAVGQPGREPIEHALTDHAAFAALPSLRRALDLELQRRHVEPGEPSSIESIVLDLVSAGPLDFDELFAHFSRTHARFGLADAQFWNLLLRMSGNEPLIEAPDPEAAAHASAPLLEIAGAHLSPIALTDGAFHHAQIALPVGHGTGA